MSVPALILLAASAWLVGLVHSLAPGHWLPVVLLSKSRRWSRARATLGALVAASGHILVSLSLAIGLLFFSELFAEEQLERVEHWSGLGVAGFGLAYAVFAWRAHSGCGHHDHTHHGDEGLPAPRAQRRPFAFLFLLGLAPCLAALPVFAAAAGQGAAAVSVTAMGFVGGVLTALVGGTWLGMAGFRHLDHPVLEHHGDTLAGAIVFLTGIALFLLPHSHTH